MGALIVEDAHGNVIIMSQRHVTVQRQGDAGQLEAPIVVIKRPGWARTVTPSTNPI